MKIFFAPNINGPKELLEFQEMVNELKKLQISVTTSMDVKKSFSDRRDFHDFDTVILDGSSKDADIGYFMAIALAHKKPVLYLLRKGEIIDPSVDALTQNAEVKKYIKIVFYTADTLSRKVKGFLQYLDQSIGKEMYTIKYTLRLSPRLDRYIHWRANEQKKHKADLIRDVLDELMKGDEVYRARLE